MMPATDLAVCAVIAESRSHVRPGTRRPGAALPGRVPESRGPRVSSAHETTRTHGARGRGRARSRRALGLAERSDLVLMKWGVAESFWARRALYSVLKCFCESILLARGNEHRENHFRGCCRLRGPLRLRWSRGKGRKGAVLGAFWRQSVSGEGRRGVHSHHRHRWFPRRLRWCRFGDRNIPPIWGSVPGSLGLECWLCC